MRIPHSFPSLAFIVIAGQLAVASDPDVFTMVPEVAAEGYQLACEIEMPTDANYATGASVPYATDHRANLPAFDRIAVFMDVSTAGGARSWAYVSADAWTSNAAELGLPHHASAPQTWQRTLQNATIASNIPGIQTGDFIDTANLEAWPWASHPKDSAGVYASDFPLYTGIMDWGDSPEAAGTPGPGCFQLHNHGAKQVVMAWNGWGSAGTDDVGLGSAAMGNPDHTGAANASAYASRKLVFLVRPKLWDVTLQKFPKNRQITPRNPQTNLGALPIQGTERFGGYDSVVLRQYRNGVPAGANMEQTLTYVGGIATFNFAPEIPAGLANYSLELHLRKNGQDRLVHRVREVVAGDAYLFYGQSNAESAMYDGNNNQGGGDPNPTYSSPWLRTFGQQGDNGTRCRNILIWTQADGRNLSYTEFPSAIGRWAMVMGRRLIDSENIPIAVFNAARGGYHMGLLQRYDANPDQLDDVGWLTLPYNRLRYRAIKSGWAGHIRALVFYQGENDFNNTTQHTNGFAALYHDWQTDYPALEKVIAAQLHVGGGVTRENIGLRNAQRKFPDIYPKVRLISTNGVPGHNGVHYTMEGAAYLGEKTAEMMRVFFYGAADSPEMSPPNPSKAEFISPTAIKVTMRQPNAVLTIQPQVAADFRATGTSAIATSVVATPGGFVVNFDRTLFGATSLDYLGHNYSTPGWIFNANGLGLVSFSEGLPWPFPVLTCQPNRGGELPLGDPVLLQCNAASTLAAIAEIVISVNGIPVTRSAGPQSSFPWTPSLPGSHRVRFWAKTTTGFTQEKELTFVVGQQAAPAGLSNGLRVWLRSTAGVQTDPYGGVAQWRDQTTAQRHFLPFLEFGTQPELEENGDGILPGIGLRYYFQCLHNTTAMPAGDYTIVLRGWVSDAATTQVLWSCGLGRLDGHFLMVQETTGKLCLCESGETTVAQTNQPIHAGQPFTISVTFDATTKASTVFLNGNSGTNGTALAGNQSSTLQLGRYEDWCSMDGGMSGLVVYDRVLPPSERVAVEQALTGAAHPLAISYPLWRSLLLPQTAASEMDDDPDGDGFSNLLEYAMAMNPTVRESAAIEMGWTTLPGGDIHPTLRFTRLDGMADIELRMNASQDLQNWAEETAAFDRIEDISSEGVRHFLLRSKRSIGSGLREFFRAEAVSLAP